MPHSRYARLSLASLTALAAFGAAASSAQARSIHIMGCDYPLVGTQSQTLVIEHRIPGTRFVSGPTAFDLAVSGTKPTLPGVAKLEVVGVSGNVHLTTSGQFGSSAADFPILDPSKPDPSMPFAEPGQDLTRFADGQISVPGQSPNTSSMITIGHPNLVLRALDANGVADTRLSAAQSTPDSDGDPTTFDAPCEEYPTLAANPVATFSTIYYGTPTPPKTATPTPTPTPVTPTVTPTPTPTPPGTPAPPTPTPTPSPRPPVKYSYTLAGSATLKTLTKGTLPLSGTADAELTLNTGAVSANLTLAATTGNLIALGFLPVKAKVAIVPQGPATGTLTDAGLAIAAKVRIKLPVVTFAGFQLAGGTNCQAKNPTDIKLKSPGEFSPFDGGTLTGTFTISDLTGCGSLTGVVSPLTAGSGNAIALKLTPRTTSAS